MDNSFLKNLDFSAPFMTYQPIDYTKTPKTEINFPLFDSPIDLSSTVDFINQDGIPIIPPRLNRDRIDNTSKQEYSEEESPSVTSTEFVSLNVPDRVKYAVNFFQQKGLTFNQAAGIVGNLMHESGDKSLNTTTNIGDKGSSYGIAQWHNERWNNLKKFAKARGTRESDFVTQLEFLWKELKENSIYGLAQLKDTNSIESATSIFMRRFERPDETKANLRSRIQNAKSIKS